MITTDQLMTIVQSWATLLGPRPAIGEEHTGRELWPVTADDGARYFLKRLGPWRNLPVADQARVLRWLTQHGIDVAEFMITDDASLFAGPPDDSFVLIPQLEAARLSPAEVLDLEPTVGRAIARLHAALADYPWSTNSYTEQLTDALLGELLLPPDVARAFAERRDQIATAIGRLPVQLVHGDLTPDNILLCAPDRIAGFIDFDHLPLAPRVWDIAKYLSRRLRLRRRDGTTTDLGRLDHIAGLLRGYHPTSPLSDEELDALPGAIAAGNLIEASYNQRIASGLLERRQLPDHADVLADTVEAARWQLANYTAVEDTVQAAII